MQNDSLQKFHALRSSLLKEREEIQQRIRDIDTALGGGEATYREPSPKLTTTSQNSQSRRGRPPRPGNAMSIREAIERVTTIKPLGLSDIVDAVQKIGYRFESSNPRNSVGAYLYASAGKKYFKRVDGKFSPVAAPETSKATKQPVSPLSPKAPKKQMSAEAKKRIADAMRKQWADKKAKKK